MSLFIYIDDELIDLSPGTIFALTINRLDFNNVGSRFVNYSNAIRIPFTANNTRIFGNAQDENSDTEVPYIFLPCRVVQDGVELVTDGSALISKSEGVYTLQVYENVINFFNAVKNLNVRDVQAFTNTAWTAAGIDTNRNTTSNIISAVLSWGKSGAIYQTNYFLPCFFYHTLVTAILEYTGLTLSGSILTDPRFRDLVIPFPNEQFKYLPEYYIDSTAASEANPVTITNIGTTEVDLFSFSPITYPVKAEVIGYLRIDAITYNTAANVFVNLYVNGVFQAFDSITSPATGAQLGAVANIDLNVGDVLNIKVQSDATTTGADIVVTFVGIGVIVPETVDRSAVYWNNLLGTNLKCDSVLQDFFTRFGIVYNQVQNTLYLKTIEEIVTDRSNINDWSGKIAKQDKELEYKSEYSTKNYFRYKASEEVKTQQIGEGLITTKSAQVTEKTVFTSDFGNSITTDVSGYTVGVIPVYDSTSTGIDTFAKEPGLRLMTLKNRIDEAAITFNASARTDYKLAYFVDGLQPKDTGFQYFLDQFYRSFGAAINKARKVIKYYNLTESDIANYDPLKMVYDDDGYYLADKIVNYVPGRVTKVELLKVG